MNPYGIYLLAPIVRQSIGSDRLKASLDKILSTIILAGFEREKSRFGPRKKKHFGKDI